MSSDSLRYIPLSYNHADSQTSALRLVLTIKPEWEGPENNIEFVRFTDGITNTVCQQLPLSPVADLSGLDESEIQPGKCQLNVLIGVQLRSYSKLSTGSLA